MKIQFNTDKTIDGDQRNQDFFSDFISKKLNRYHSQITRIEVHLTDQNGNKEGINDIRCLLEARLAGLQPIAVSEQAQTSEQAVSGALDKLKAVLETTLGRLQN